MAWAATAWQTRKKKIIAAAVVIGALAAVGSAAPGAPQEPTPQNAHPRVMSVPLLSLVAFATPNG
jgi:hypothetical protein